MTPDEVRRLPINEALIFTRGRHPIRAKLLLYFEEPYFRRLTEIPALAKSDRIITAPPPVAEKSASTPVEEPTATQGGSPRLRKPNVFAQYSDDLLFTEPVAFHSSVSFA